MSQPLPTPRPFRKILTPPTPPQAIFFPQVGHLLHLRQNIFQNSPIHHPPLNTLATTFMCIISLKLNHSQKNKNNSILNRRNYSSFLKLFVFCHQKKKSRQKSRRGFHKIFFNHQYQLVQVPQSLISNSTSLFPVVLPFLENISTPR